MSRLERLSVGFFSSLLLSIALEANGAPSQPEDSRCFVEVDDGGGRLDVYAPRMDFQPGMYLKGWKFANVRVRKDRGEGFSIVTNTDREVRVSFRSVVGETCEIEQYNVSASLDIVTYAGGKLIVDGRRFEIPLNFEKMLIAGGKALKLTLVSAAGDSIDISFAKPTKIWFQDSRMFGVSSFSLRLGLTEQSRLTAGEGHVMDFVLSSERGIRIGKPDPVVITAGREWIPYRATPEIAAGTALDFSGLFGTNAPCGTYGRVIAVGEHFEFEGIPGVVQRFYGVNLCFTANFLSSEESKSLVANLRRVGYNSLRIHHHDDGLVRGMQDSTTLNPKAIDRLDALLAACSEAGIYVTTDLFVSRSVPYREIGIDKDGIIGNMTAKTLVRENSRMRENYYRFVRNWLTHVNPYTQRRWADEPALAWISFINEGNPGNPGCGANDHATLARELEMDREIKRFVRDELGCRALVTSMNGWTNVPGTSLPRNEVYDYVDDHYYFDHPEFLDGNWSVPSRCSNVLPFADSCLSLVRCRLFGKPYTISEFNYAYPSMMRGCGGLVFGAMAALQDWSVLWRFAWSHSAERIRNHDGQGSAFFDMAGDPIGLASERAALALFRRGDLKPLEKATAVRFSREYLDTDAAYASRNGQCGDLAWYRRIGIVLGDSPFDARTMAEDGQTRIRVADLVTEEERRASAVKADIGKGVFTVDTPLTQGAFVRSGDVSLSSLSFGVRDCFATVWATSLDGRPLNDSNRILVSHLTDVLNSETAFSDKTRTVMTSFGHVPHLMRRGRVDCSLAVTAGTYHLYALAPNGERAAELPTSLENGRLIFSLDVGSVPGTATCCYEIVRTDAKTGLTEQNDIRVDLASGTDATSAIQSAIDRCFLAGGGTVRVPTGRYGIKTVRLRSNVTLHLERDAKLIASRQPDDYAGLIRQDRVEPLPDSFFRSHGVGVKESTNRWCRAVVRVFKAHDVAIVGEEGSEIDGRNCFDPNGEEKYRGPHAICVNLSTNVSLSGYTVRDAGNYAHYISRSRNVVVRGVTIRGGHDGIDFFHSRDIAVRDCDIQSGDDCVAGYGNRNWKIRNCRLNSSCSIFRIGGNDVEVDNVVAYGPGKYAHRWTYKREDLAAGLNPTDYGRRNTLSFFTFFTGKSASNPSDGIVFRNCRVANVDKLMHLNFLGNEQWQNGPALRNVTFEGLVAERLAGPSCMYAPGSMPVAVRFLRSKVSFGTKVSEFSRGANVGSVIIDGLEVDGVDGPFLRTWKGRPEWAAEGLKGVSQPIEQGDGQFLIKPI